MQGATWSGIQRLEGEFEPYQGYQVYSGYINRQVKLFRLLLHRHTLVANCEKELDHADKAAVWLYPYPNHPDTIQSLRRGERGDGGMEWLLTLSHLSHSFSSNMKLVSTGRQLVRGRVNRPQPPPIL